MSKLRNNVQFSNKGKVSEISDQWRYVLLSTWLFTCVVPFNAHTITYTGPFYNPFLVFMFLFAYVISFVIRYITTEIRLKSCVALVNIKYTNLPYRIIVRWTYNVLTRYVKQNCHCHNNIDVSIPCATQIITFQYTERLNATSIRFFQHDVYIIYIVIYFIQINAEYDPFCTFCACNQHHLNIF